MKINNLKSVTIVGLGLIGGSIALGLKERRDKKLIIKAIVKNKNKFKTLKYQSVFNTISEKIENVSNETDLIILATPINEILKILPRLTFLSQKVPIMDVASTKGIVCNSAKLLNLNFWGTHPMAGKEVTGMENADPNLFVGKPWIVCSGNKQIINRNVEKVINILGGKTIFMDTVEHDSLTTLASHLPMLISTMLTATVSNSKSPYLKQIVSNGLIDTTRLASQDSRLLTDIIMTNPNNVITALNDFKNELNTIINLCVKHDEKKLTVYINKARSFRKSLLN
jgi:prephenate dehydrogenase